MNAAVWKTVALLTASNVFMTVAWYAHLKHLLHWRWFVVALIAWSVALFEYLLTVPANRIGYTVMSLGQLKVLQEVIALAVFVPFALLYMKEPLMGHSGVRHQVTLPTGSRAKSTTFQQDHPPQGIGDRPVYGRDFRHMSLGA